MLVFLSILEEFITNLSWARLPRPIVLSGMRAAYVRSDGINEMTSVQRSTERGKIGRVEPVNYLQQLHKVFSWSTALSLI